ncbi:MAG: hypothetical protein A2622_08230 [Bdellovibrionales bacterium RIFCSPHIGHO2_01_FULL_40_29]|nr:MAG: hypothetical protein A2622_08230 [Bdellovibrionales bacterium RIFCSPHIGHO2_01_FULL_40_29]OFZ35483.1 MAG: hypothetical protein A3D17_07465 [Bdellovibrionales bacterium RIFCSPHIGHO2_02_FULL_40_15]
MINLIHKVICSLSIIGILSLQFSCANHSIKTVHGDPVVESPIPVADVEKIDTQLTDAELQKYAYEIGLDPLKDLTADELTAINKRKKVRNLERTLDSQKERFSYSKVLPWLQTDDEKIDYLSIPSIEGRHAWVNKNKIWQRAQNLKNFTDIMENLDIAAGMPADYVRKAWGEPESVEFSGNPIYKNERWKYLKQVSTPNGYRQEKRFVYFEGGRVVGWETE